MGGRWDMDLVYSRDEEDEYDPYDEILIEEAEKAERERLRQEQNSRTNGEQMNHENTERDN